MAIFKMTVGLPASGKSTYARELRELGYKVFSSDELREKTGEKDHSKVFSKLHKDIREELKAGHNCILDATNLGRKKRQSFLDEVRKIGAQTECELFVIPVPVLKERNKERENNHGVHDGVIDRMLRNFECPWYSDGFDRIDVHYYQGECDLEYSRDDLMKLDQENPHHTMTVGEHENAVHDYIAKRHMFTETYPFLLEAAKYHDDGKYFTKVFQNSRGEKTDIAHFYNHDNVGAYLFLLRGFCLEQFEEADEYPLTDWGILYVANLIGWHMRPVTAWKVSEKAMNKDRDRIGEEMFNDLCKLREADIYGK